MKKAIALLGLGLIAMFAMGADDDCSVEEDVPPPGKQANNGNGNASEPASNEPDLTAGQENAIKSAQSYLDLSGFSKAGLIGQLSSSAGEGYPRKDAVFAVNYLSPNWNAEAYESAKSYLELSAFSLSGLIDQLSSSAGDQFTQAQAEYGAKKAYNE